MRARGRGLAAAWVAVTTITIAVTAPGAHADDSEALRQLVTTKLTPIRSADGEPGTIRRFDRNGELSHAEYVDREGGHLRREVLDVSENRLVRERTITVDGKILRKTVERFLVPDALRERETWTSTREDGKLDERLLETFHGDEVQKQWFDPSGKLLREATEPAIEKQNSYDRFWGDRWTQYASCLSEKGRIASGNIQACAQYYQNSESAIINADPAGIANLGIPRCQTDYQLFLPNGYRIDRKSCEAAGVQQDPSPMQILERSVALTTDHYLSCLNHLNPGYAKQYARTIAETHPRIQCAGTPDGAAWVGDHWCTGTLLQLYGQITPASAAYCYKHNPDPETVATSGAFVQRGYPVDMTLTGLDPSRPVNRLSSREYKFRDADQQITTLGSSLFHETLHSAGHRGAPDHNDPQMPEVDDVYGCEAACALESDKYAVTEGSVEGCLACARASGAIGMVRRDCDNGTTPSAQVTDGATPCNQVERDSCGFLPPAARMRAFWHKFFQRDHAISCKLNLRSEAAKELETQYPTPASRTTPAYHAAVDQAVSAHGWRYFNRLKATPGGCRDNMCEPCRFMSEDSYFTQHCPAVANGNGDPTACIQQVYDHYLPDYQAERAAVASAFPDFARRIDSYERGRQVVIQRRISSGP